MNDFNTAITGSNSSSGMMNLIPVPLHSLLFHTSHYVNPGMTSTPTSSATELESPSPPSPSFDLIHVLQQHGVALIDLHYDYNFTIPNRNNNDEDEDCIHDSQNGDVRHNGNFTVILTIGMMTIRIQTIYHPQYLLRHDTLWINSINNNNNNNNNSHHS
jgi:hypothetical protein